MASRKMATRGTVTSLGLMVTHGLAELSSNTSHRYHTDTVDVFFCGFLEHHKLSMNAHS